MIQIFAISIVIAIIAVILFKKNINKILFDNHDNNHNHNHNLPLVQKNIHDDNEIFHVSGEKVTFDEANTVCQQYGAKLASYDQLLHAYLHGNEFCNVGWTQNETGYYLTQKDTWQKLQYYDDVNKKNMCGNIGINGGKFPKNTKLGVNCYGKRPEKKHEFEFPKLPKKPITKKKEVKIYDDLIIVPYNRHKWSRDDVIENYARF